MLIRDNEGVGNSIPAGLDRLSQQFPSTLFRFATGSRYVRQHGPLVIKVEHRRDATPASAQQARVPKRIFSGLIKCGCCGGGMSSNGADRKGVRIQCSAYKESGSCKNSRRVYLDDIEALAIKG